MTPNYTTLKHSISPTIPLIPHVSDENIIPLSFPNGVRFNATYINNFTKRREYERQLHFKGPLDVYLVASYARNFYHLVLWSEEMHCYRCNCYEYRRDQHCSHADDVEQYVDAANAEKAMQTEESAVETTKDEATTEYSSMQALKHRDINAYWREIAKEGKRRDKAAMDVYWREAKALQLAAQTSPQ